MPWSILLQEAGTSISLDGVPWEVFLGPAGLTAYLLWDNIQLKKINKELRVASEEMAKAALAALKKAGE